MRLGAKRIASRYCCFASKDGVSAVDGAEKPPYRRGSGLSTSNWAQATVGAPAKPVPTPVVKIDNLTDPFATLVTVEYGDKLGELLETITALKNLNLNIRRAKLVSGKSGSTINAFYLTEADTSEKIVKSARLEEIRMTVLNLLVATYPVSLQFVLCLGCTPMIILVLSTGAQRFLRCFVEQESAQSLSGGKPSDSELTQPLGRRRSVVQTLIDVTEAPNGAASVLKITTSDRPGLLVDIVRVLKDINLNVVSAEVDTVGTQAQDEFFITYHGEPLTPPMVTLVTNALQYYLSLNEVAKEESY
ncbi:hypothetical protein QJQ45_018562 [Haematococcus lacustris]|nr:hypothetical protein QJQ45_018562 [Haematococcus lacustris]